MAKNKKELMGKINDYLREQRQRQRFGGVVSLRSLWTIIRPTDLNKTIGNKATIKARELENGHIYLYINLPLADNVYEELRLIGWSDLEVEDEIDISSIIVIIFDNERGETVLRYDAVCLDDGEFLEEADVKSLMIHRNADLLMHSNNPMPMGLKVTYEGGNIKKNKVKIITGKEYIVLYEGDYLSDTWKIHKLSGYTNALPLTHGLILVEGQIKDNRFPQKCFYNVLNADGSIFCHDVSSIVLGCDYLIASTNKSKLWWFNSITNLWEEKDNPGDMISIKKMQINESLYCYVYHCSYEFEDIISYDESTHEVIRSEVSCSGVLDKNGKWRIELQENIDNIDHCLSIIVIQKEGEITLYDSEKKSYKDGSFKEIISADDCVISHNTILLKSKKMQGVFDAKAKTLIIPFCIDENYHILPQTLGEGLIGVYTEEQENKRYSTKKKKKYFFLDYSGKIKLTIEQGFEIDSKFQEGRAIISKTDYYRGESHRITIDIDGNVISKHYDTFRGAQDDYYEDEMRNLDRDNWDAMTDGMYGDYPDDGYDGDYEFMGY